MNKIVQIKIFNDILDQFFEFLETNFPFFKSDIMLTRSTAEFIRRSNPRLVVEQFMSLVGPYNQQIFECDARSVGGDPVDNRCAARPHGDGPILRRCHDGHRRHRQCRRDREQQYRADRHL